MTDKPITKKIISKENAEQMAKFYKEIAKIAKRLDANANSMPRARQILIGNILKIYHEVC